MKKPLRLLLVAALLLSLVGCAATIPVKVATKTAKVGVKATKTTVKTGTSVITPDKDKSDQ